MIYMKNRNLAKRIARTYLFLMSFQYIPIEGMSTSLIKVASLMIAPFILLLHNRFSKALLFGLLTIISIVISALYNLDSVRTLALFYKIGFIVMFIMSGNIDHC